MYTGQLGSIVGVQRIDLSKGIFTIFTTFGLRFCFVQDMVHQARNFIRMQPVLCKFAKFHTYRYSCTQHKTKHVCNTPVYLLQLATGTGEVESLMTPAGRTAPRCGLVEPGMTSTATGRKCSSSARSKVRHPPKKKKEINQITIT